MHAPSLVGAHLLPGLETILLSDHKLVTLDTILRLPARLRTSNPQDHGDTGPGKGDNEFVIQ